MAHRRIRPIGDIAGKIFFGYVVPDIFVPESIGRIARMYPIFRVVVQWSVARERVVVGGKVDGVSPALGGHLDEKIAYFFGTFSEYGPQGFGKERSGSHVGIDQEQHSVIADTVRFVDQ